MERIDLKQLVQIRNLYLQKMKHLMERDRRRNPRKKTKV
jgi:hypothetical protein